MKIEFTEREWSHIKVALLTYMSQTDKDSELKFDDNLLIKEYLKYMTKLL